MNRKPGRSVVGPIRANILFRRMYRAADGQPGRRIEVSAARMDRAFSVPVANADRVRAGRRCLPAGDRD